MVVGGVHDEETILHGLILLRLNLHYKCFASTYLSMGSIPVPLTPSAAIKDTRETQPL